MSLRKWKALAAAAALALLASAVHAQELIEIYPVGVYPIDVENIQAALDDLGERGADGILLLKARDKGGMETPFDFGQDPDPALRGSVAPQAMQTGAIEFRGENLGHTQTTILGGNSPITTNRHDEISVRNITFQSPYQRAILVREATGVEIHDNIVLDVESSDDPAECCAYAISVSANEAGALDEITGSIRITGNIVAGATGYFSYGLVVFSTNAAILIADNNVSDVNVAIALHRYQQHTIVRGNVLQAQVPRAGFYSTGFEIYPGVEPDARIFIGHNTIVAQDSDAVGAAYGIYISDFDPTYGDFRNSAIVENDIWLEHGVVGIELDFFVQFADASMNWIALNRLQGTAAYGIRLQALSGLADIYWNRLYGNNLRDLEGPAAHISLDSETHDNYVYCHADDSVVDLGTDNVIVRGGSD